MVIRRAWTIGRRNAARLAVVASIAAAMGCSPETSIPERTIRVAVSTNAPDAFDELTITVERGGTIKFNQTYGQTTIDALPDSLLLRNAMAFDDMGHEISIPVRVRVAGDLSDSQTDSGIPPPPVIERSARFAFVIDRPVLLAMPLCQKCVGVVCGTDETCVLGKCQNDTVDASALPVDDGSQPLEGIECPNP
jgi:hypothetical protein